jgi:hypothetical protein
MTSIRIRAAIALIAVASTVASAPAMTAPIGQPLAAKPAGGLAEQVFWRGGWGPGAFVGGLAVGAVIGGAIAAPYYYGPGPYYGPGYAPPPGDEVSSCMQRYKSYDPNTGTFLGKDGRRHPCMS